MIGVVVWGKEESESAVIWCEDMAMLAYLDGRSHLKDPQYWPKSGDLVELENEQIGNLCYARQVSMVPQEAPAKTPAELRCPYNPECSSLTFPVCDYISPPCKTRCG